MLSNKKSLWRNCMSFSSSETTSFDTAVTLAAFALISLASAIVYPTHSSIFLCVFFLRAAFHSRTYSPPLYMGSSLFLESKRKTLQGGGAARWMSYVSDLKSEQTSCHAGLLKRNSIVMGKKCGKSVLKNNQIKSSHA